MVSLSIHAFDHLSGPSRRRTGCHAPKCVIPSAAEESRTIVHRAGREMGCLLRDDWLGGRSHRRQVLDSSTPLRSAQNDMGVVLGKDRPAHPRPCLRQSAGASTRPGYQLSWFAQDTRTNPLRHLPKVRITKSFLLESAKGYPRLISSGFLTSHIAYSLRVFLLFCRLQGRHESTVLTPPLLFGTA